QSPRPTAFWIYGTQACEVEVDPETGEIDVVNFAAAHDCGRALNLQTCKQQVEGAAVMGLGHALREELIYIDGYPKNATMVDYKVPTVRDFPVEPSIVFVDAPHREGPYGAKGVGETALTATSSAVGLAVSHAIGCQLTKIPIQGDDVLAALMAKKGGAE
ncbi:MAG: xanthine dehydrogenase family protein molybdopterin-binding subunit, partial [Fretibacterium sp.]|nr:xanthine dehydrogenase family protein molybdopterin-binding subunit [Fretibacterium sp.]